MASVTVRSSGLKRVIKRWARRAFATTEKIISISGRSGPSLGLRILTYHRVVNDPGDPFAVSPVAFAAQMELLAALEIVRPVRVAMESLHCHNPSSPMLVLTFDDGTQDFMDNAWPVLNRLELPAIVYVNPSRTGTPGFLSWSDLKELSLRGIQIESHGMEHRSLGRMERAEIRRQLRQSKTILEDKLGRSVSSFAYPYGTLRDFNSDTRDEIQLAGYNTACTSLNGLNGAGADPLELHRTKIEQGDDPIFSWILAGCMDRWEWIDRHLSRLQNHYAAEG